MIKWPGLRVGRANPEDCQFGFLYPAPNGETEGLTLIELSQVLNEAWLRGIATKGDFARYHANTVGAVASLGHITTQISKGRFDRTWRITPTGIDLLWTINELEPE